MENKTKHLEMIQSIISRMTSNSFALRGWAVTLVAGIFALADRNSNKSFYLISYIPIMAFWGLDAYYLFQERLYRALYDRVRNTDCTEIDFCMDTSIVESHNDSIQYCKCALSKSVFWFYFPLLFATSIGIILVAVFNW